MGLLSERNLIEIVNVLVESRLLEVVYTADGREYLTPQQVIKEIRDELYLHGGRVNLVELQQLINIDLSHIENKASEVVRTDKDLELVLGQLIDRTYLDSLAEEVNDLLQENGQVTIGQLTKQYDLPSDFLMEAVLERLGTIIQGQSDPYDKGVIFTDTFVKMHRAQIRGIFSAITRPTPVGNIMNKYGFAEKLFYTVLEKLVSDGQLAGSITGGRQDKALYVPDIYNKTQMKWVDNFYSQNGYLGWSPALLALVRSPRSATQPTWIADLGERTNKTVLQAKPDVLLVPDSFDSDTLRSDDSKSSTMLIFVEDSSRKPAAAPDLPTPEDTAGGKGGKRDERRKKAGEGKTSTGGGSGYGSREVKTKGKSKKQKRREAEEEEAATKSSSSGGHGRKQELPFMTIEEIEEVLRKKLPDCDDGFVTELAEDLHRPLTKSYQEVAKSVFLASTGGGSGTSRKETHRDLQEKVTGLWTNIKLFEKGLKLFEEEAQSQLAKHLLKTLCTDVTNMLVNFVASEQMMSVNDPKAITIEMRFKLISNLPEHIKEPMTKLHTSLAGKQVDEFLSALETVAGEMQVMLKKADKKKERQLVFNHRQSLSEELGREEEPATVLHLAVLLLFQQVSHAMVHAPGRCVPLVISHLQQHLSAEQHGKLTNFQDLVIRCVKAKQQSGEDGDNDAENLSTTLHRLVPDIKDMALNPRKASGDQED
ncbi:PREDICTED: E3 UFM1-protein ligase 1-like [Branchiostoma belcheri]|uniref:E3 UFM1-protein ligase 1 n=1 Tax=Branchiostoma belcheri TaxID=7741 RepID=A0A6P4YL68_BRABE|nr:PREDICTED: E3 UFM1-protein ligase 1-like [Branchiostoma belcheri]